MPIVVLDNSGLAFEFIYREHKRLDALVLEKYRERFSNTDLIKDLPLKKEIDRLNQLKFDNFRLAEIVGMTNEDWETFELKATV